MIVFRPFRLALLLLLCGLAGQAWADVPYETEITGVSEGDLAASLRDNSQLVKLQDRPPPSVAALRRRATADLPTLEQILHDAGYWAAHIEVAIDQAKQPTKVTLHVDPGPLYRLTRVVFTTPQGGAPAIVGGEKPAAFGLAVGDAARAAPVLDAEPKILTALANHGYPFAKIADRRVVIDDQAHSMTVTYTIDTGARARFGALTTTGLTSLDPRYVERRVTWKRGALYDGRKVAATRTALVDSNLFSIAEVRHADRPDPDGTVPMTIVLSQRLPHSIGAGVQYGTHYGFGVTTFWEDRNLFGYAENLRITGTFAQSQLSLATQFRRPDFGATGQDLILRGELADESPVAYTSRRLRLLGGIERRLDPRLTVGAGLAYEHGNVSAHNMTQHYQLASLPLYLRRDDSDNLLNPTRGNRESIEVTPYEGTSGSAITFVTTKLAASVYQPIAGERAVLAGFARVGSIFGASRDQLPADHRLYAGGGGSIRGYGFQLVGPLDEGDKPLGGRSSLEFGTELRVKVTETIGIVPFLEAGNVYATSLPRPTGRLFYGAGLGLRYYTAVGPIRLDIATPLSRRHVDSPVQVYISLGQAF